MVGEKCKPAKPTRGPMQFAPLGGSPPQQEPVEPSPQPANATPLVRRQAAKCDPKLIAAARELRDRWVDHVARNPGILAAAGKYDVSRALGDRSARPMLEAA